MKTFKYQIEGKEFLIRFDEKNATVADFQIDGQHPKVSEEEMRKFAAVISLALLEYDVEVVHDDEPGVITVDHHGSRWSNPAESMNERGSLLSQMLGW